MNTFAQVFLTLALAAGAAIGFSWADFGADVQAGVSAAVDLFEDSSASASVDADASASGEVQDSVDLGAEADIHVEGSTDASAETSQLDLWLGGHGDAGLNIGLGE